MPSLSSPPTPAKIAKPPRLPGGLSIYRLFLRPIFFKLDPEFVHDLLVFFGRIVQSTRIPAAVLRKAYVRRPQSVHVKIGPLDFPNPVGLAAGFDKNGVIVPLLEDLGFGFVEVGTITPRPQLGNPRPRLIRVPERRGIINRMGFNNDGIDAVTMNMRRWRDRTKIPVGVNLGKNRDTPNSEAVKDYERLFKAFQFGASYFTVNISSPNTPGLRDLQSGTFVKDLGDRILALRDATGLAQPVFLKLSPDLGREELAAICRLCGPGKPYSGLVLTNTLPTDLGGLSGYPLKAHSVAMLKAARALLPEQVPVISVGGIETAEDIIERLKLGATAIQIYTGLIYQGPALARRLIADLQRTMKRLGIHELSRFRER